MIQKALTTQPQVVCTSSFSGSPFKPFRLCLVGAGGACCPAPLVDKVTKPLESNPNLVLFYFLSFCANLKDVKRLGILVSVSETSPFRVLKVESISKLQTHFLYTNKSWGCTQPIPRLAFLSFFFFFFAKQRKRCALFIHHSFSFHEMQEIPKCHFLDFS